MIPENPCCGLSRLFPVQLPLLSIQPVPTRHFPSISLSQEIAPLSSGPWGYPVSGDLCANRQKSPSPLEDGARIPSLGSRELARVSLLS